MRGWTFNVLFACGGLIAPSIWAAYRYLLPDVYRFEGTTEYLFEFVFLVLLWPTAIPTMMEMDIEGSRPIIVYVFGTLMNVVCYAVLGGIIWAASDNYFRRKS